jgi:hypothetical protein
MEEIRNIGGTYVVTFHAEGIKSSDLADCQPELLQYSDSLNTELCEAE